MTRQTEELVVEVLVELLGELRALRRERERAEHEYRLAETLARRGYPPPRRYRRWG